MSDLARACVPRPALARRRQDGDDDREAVDAFARDAEAHLVAIRARIERSGLESSIGLRASRREKTPRRLVEVIEDDDADAVVRRDAHAPLLEVVQADEEAHAQRHQEVEHGPGEARREGLRVNQPVRAGVAVDGTPALTG